MKINTSESDWMIKHFNNKESRYWYKNVGWFALTHYTGLSIYFETIFSISMLIMFSSNSLRGNNQGKVVMGYREYFSLYLILNSIKKNS